MLVEHYIIHTMKLPLLFNGNTILNAHSESSKPGLYIIVVFTSQSQAYTVTMALCSRYSCWFLRYFVPVFIMCCLLDPRENTNDKMLTYREAEENSHWTVYQTGNSVWVCLEGMQLQVFWSPELGSQRMYFLDRFYAALHCFLQFSGNCIQTCLSGSFVLVANTSTFFS